MKMGVALICTLLACADEARDVVQIRAANDFNCPEDKIVVRNIGGQSFRAWACGGVGTYNCVPTYGGRYTCAREQ
jgi:hypothetical protein